MIPIIRWNTESCTENDLCLRLDEVGNGEKFRAAIINNHDKDDESNLWVKVEWVTPQQWKEIENNTE